jgi:hypothetical protein
VNTGSEDLADFRIAVGPAVMRHFRHFRFVTIGLQRTSAEAGHCECLLGGVLGESGGQQGGSSAIK